MAIGGALTKTDLDRAVEKFENYPLDLRARYAEIIAAPNKEELIDELDDNEQQAFLIYIELADKINEMVKSRIRQAHSKTLTFAAPNRADRTVMMDIDSDEELQTTVDRRWSL